MKEHQKGQSMEDYHEEKSIMHDMDQNYLAGRSVSIMTIYKRSM